MGLIKRINDLHFLYIDFTSVIFGISHLSKLSPLHIKLKTIVKDKNRTTKMSGLYSKPKISQYIQKNMLCKDNMLRTNHLAS